MIIFTLLLIEKVCCGVLVLQPGEEDTQEPHESDEVYYVISGDGFLRIKDKDYKVSKDKLFLLQKTLNIIFIEIQKNSKSCIFLVVLILN